MKHQTGWAKCPICEGKTTIKTMTWESGQFVTGSALEKVLGYEYNLPHKITHEPCQTCKDQEFKGCLPVYSEVEEVRDPSHCDGVRKDCKHYKGAACTIVEGKLLVCTGQKDPCLACNGEGHMKVGSDGPSVHHDIWAVCLNCKGTGIKQ